LIHDPEATIESIHFDYDDADPLTPEQIDELCERLNTPIKYSRSIIAAELRATSLGTDYFGSALYAAKDMDEVTQEQKESIQRYLRGTPNSTDHIRLQEAANAIA